MAEETATYLFQQLNKNCNDCKNMVRDFEKRKSFDHLHEGQLNAGFRINYGTCTKFNKPVSFIPNWCVLETQNCFTHRKD